MTSRLCIKKGKENVAIDALSRRPNLVSITSVKSDIWKKIQEHWEEDPELKQLIQQVQQNIHGG